VSCDWVGFDGARQGVREDAAFPDEGKEKPRPYEAGTGYRNRQLKCPATEND